MYEIGSGGFPLQALCVTLLDFMMFYSLSLLLLSVQLFQGSRSPGRDPRLRGPKVIIAKPGSFHRPTRAAGPVIGGHRYWQGQTLQPETRSGRSPRRHSPGYRKADHASPQPPANQSGLLGVSFSKASNLKHLKARSGASQKKVPQNNKPARQNSGPVQVHKDVINFLLKNT